MADEARREKALRELVRQGELMAHAIERCNDERARPHAYDVEAAQLWQDALADARHLGVVPW